MAQNDGAGGARKDGIGMDPDHGPDQGTGPKDGIDPGQILAGYRILFCVTGGIAAFKAAATVSRLAQLGARVRVIMTASAAAFVTPLTFQALSGEPVWTGLFDPQRVGAVDHVELAHDTDVGVVAPATANIIGKLANGIADDAVSTVLCGLRAPVVVAPAMESGMLENPAVQANLARLQSWGWQIVGPVAGHLASGRQGLGRMVEPDALVAAVVATAAKQQDLDGRHIIVTAGPTREYMDPVRFLSNPSTGRMGFAIAAAAQQRGADVTLIHGPVTLAPPAGVTMVPVASAAEMYTAVTDRLVGCDILIKAAAVADFRPAEKKAQKVKKNDADLSLTLTRNPDILAAAGRHRQPGQILVGFAAESHNTLHFARRKLVEKNIDLIVANDISEAGSGFAGDTNRVHLLFADGRQQSLPLLTKRQVADRLLDAVKELLITATKPSDR